MFSGLRIFPNKEFHSRFPETAAFAGGITMQAMNRIQNAMINANACIQGALVVDGANAHRAYPSFVACDTSPVTKCPGQWSSCVVTQTLKRSRERFLRLALQERGQLTSGPTGSTWRPDNHQMQMPATMWAMLVLNPAMCG
jgi:hypothetical protein